MPSIRIGLSTQFNLENEQVGIGTTNPTEFLEVIGNIKAEGAAGGSGVSTFREYQGFHQSEQGIANNIVIDNATSGPFSSLSADLVISGETTISSGSTVEIGKTKTLTVTDKFAVPFGDTNSRDSTPEAGTTRFNQDFGTLEFFDGNNWKTVNSYARGGAAGRGVFAAGYSGHAEADTDIMTYIQVSTLGNAIDFGTLNGNSQGSRRAGCSNGTRGLAGGGTPNSTHIDYLTIAVGGGSQDFGDLTVGRYATSSCSSSTRGVWMAGYQHPAGAKNEIDYVEIATLGNALDFGDTTSSTLGITAASSTTRGFCFGLGSTSYPYGKGIDMITFASKGNAIDFGECQNGIKYAAAGSDSTRAVMGGRQGPATAYGGEVMQRFDLASGGNAVNFGNLTVSRESGSGAVTNGTRAVFGGGFSAPTTADIVETIDYTVIQSSGNALDFGNMTSKQCYYAAISDTHGGLGGF